MICLSTGLPGHGKTLYTIAWVNELAKKEHRPVFYSGISDLALDWQEINPEKWFECPAGSIIVIDECQRIFRPRGSGSRVPEYVSALETHRHKGLDIFLITQHPMLIDANVRRLTERHSHICRRFGMQRSTIFQYESCKDQPLSNTSIATRIDWKFPKEVFSFYKSAEVHTVKSRLPMKFYLLVAIPLVLILLVTFFVRRHYKDGQFIVPGTESIQKIGQESKPSNESGTLPAGASGAPQTQSMPPKSSLASRTDKPPPMTVQEYLEAHQPRIDGLEYTAPVYDDVTKPQEPPMPVACLDSKSKGCKCYSQQATLLVMSQALCKNIVKNGFFQSFQLASVERRIQADQNQKNQNYGREFFAPSLAPRLVESGNFIGEIPPDIPNTLSPSPVSNPSRPLRR